MARRWILATLILTSICWGVPALQPALAAQSLAERLSFFLGDDDAAQTRQPVRRDDRVHPAGASAPRAAKNESTSRGPVPRSTGGTSIFSRLRLPGMGPQPSSAPRRDTSNPPLPYDPAELEAGNRPAAPARHSATSPATTTPRPAASVGARTAGNRTAATASPPVGADVSEAPQTARRSPRADGSSRHNELAEALTGLRDRAPTDEETHRDAIAPPAVVVDEATPAYLRGSEATPAPAVDIADALSAGIPLASPAARPAPPAPRPAASAPRPTSAPVMRRAEPRSTVTETAVAAALGAGASRGEVGETDAEEESLDAIPPQSAPSPRATASGGSGTAAGKPTSTIAHGSVPVRAGNLRPRADLLLSGRQPVIESSIAGPPRIIVGRTAEYRIQLKNSGDAAARDLAATVSIPVWADVVDASGSNGVIDRSGAGTGDQGSVIQWQLYELAPGATQTLTLQIVPRSGRPLQLGVQWEHAPVVGEAIVEVEEPRLKMEIDGPGEVMFGKAQRYTLRLSNPGTGDAEEVVIELTPPGGDPQKPVRHTVGALPAGASKAIELELTAREAGELRMLAAVGAAGDLRAETTKTVLCRKAELEIDWRGPEQNFSGAIATYYLRVRNPGTAPADRVAVTATLPVGAEFIDASSGSVWNSDLRQVAWQVGALTAGEERFIQLRCRMTAAGVNHLELAAQTAAGDLSDVVRAEIAVQALADLKLAVADPQGVIPVGETVAYEIKVQNRGQSAARGVNVTAMFSAGIDPTHVEGGQYEINDGRVMFRSIDSLAAGGEVVLRIHAKASAEGTHVFRAEVACEELDIQLAAQETTRFFIEADRWADASAAYSEGEATKR